MKGSEGPQQYGSERRLTRPVWSHFSLMILITWVVAAVREVTFGHLAPPLVDEL